MNVVRYWAVFALGVAAGALAGFVSEAGLWRPLRRKGVSLTLSGHTHGGQIWPFSWIVALVQPYLAGLHREGDAQIYVSRGTGFWGPPMRVFAPPEIAVLTLHPA